MKNCLKVVPLSFSWKEFELTGEILPIILVIAQRNTSLATNCQVCELLIIKSAMQKGKEKKAQDSGKQEEKKKYQVVLIADDVANSLKSFDDVTPIVLYAHISACKKYQELPSWTTF